MGKVSQDICFSFKLSLCFKSCLEILFDSDVHVQAEVIGLVNSAHASLSQQRLDAISIVMDHLADLNDHFSLRGIRITSLRKNYADQVYKELQLYWLAEAGFIPSIAHTAKNSCPDTCSTYQ